jgi:hypothetical protein
MDPSYMLLKMFLMLNEKKRSFAFGDVAVRDPRGCLLSLMAERGLQGSDAFEMPLRTPICNQCNCDTCKAELLEKRAVRFWHSPKTFRGEPVLLMRLVEHSTLSFVGAFEWLSNAFTGKQQRKKGCPSRYCEEEYTTLSRLSDEYVFSNADDRQLLHEYNQSARIGNEIFMATELDLTWER